jgi:hypothetical protein
MKEMITTKFRQSDATCSVCVTVPRRKRTVSITQANRLMKLMETNTVLSENHGKLICAGWAECIVSQTLMRVEVLQGATTHWTYALVRESYSAHY